MAKQDRFALFRLDDSDKVPDERLLKLYWNRAALKKAFSGLRDERFKLNEKLRQQEATTQKVRDELQALERMLSEPDSALNAAVYYHLRGLWRFCQERLAERAAELARQHEDNERKRQIMKFNQQRQGRLKELNEHIREGKEKVDRLKAVWDGTRERLERLRGFWNYFRRRKLDEGLAGQRRELEQAQAEVEGLFDQRLKVESGPWPEFPGLSLEARRLINIELIALAQELYLYFHDLSLAQMTRDAMNRRAKDVRYGMTKECAGMMMQINSALTKLDVEEFDRRVRTRAQALRAKLEFRGAADTVPMSDALATIETSLSAADSRVPIELNVLGEDLWDIYQALRR